MVFLIFLWVDWDQKVFSLTQCSWGYSHVCIQLGASQGYRHPGWLLTPPLPWASPYSIAFFTTWLLRGWKWSPPVFSNLSPRTGMVSFPLPTIGQIKWESSPYSRRGKNRLCFLVRSRKSVAISDLLQVIVYMFAYDRYMLDWRHSFFILVPWVKNKFS